MTDRTDSIDDPGTDGRSSRPLLGFAGLGQMGAPMVRRLRDSAFDVIAHDHSEKARRRLAGEPWLSVTGRALDLAGCDVVITILPDSDAVEDVLVTSGLNRRLRHGATVIDMSSSDPARTRTLAAGLNALGVRMIDAPVSGGVEGARAGTLSIMVGGDPEDVAAWRPLLRRFGQAIVHVGGTGAGHATKALNNLLSATALLITGEAMLVARRFGLDPAVLLTAINGSSGRNTATERKFPAFILTGTFASGFSARLMGKDIGIALSLAHETGTPAPLAEQVACAWTVLCQRLRPGADHTEVVRPQAADAGAELWPASGGDDDDSRERDSRESAPRPAEGA